jgi:hypothetical protein
MYQHMRCDRKSLKRFTFLSELNTAVAPKPGDELGQPAVFAGSHKQTNRPKANQTHQHQANVCDCEQAAAAGDDFHV